MASSAFRKQDGKSNYACTRYVFLGLKDFSEGYVKNKSSNRYNHIAFKAILMYSILA